MGSGIAQICAQGELNVTLFDLEPSALERAKQHILKNLEYLVKKNKFTTDEAQNILKRIHFTSDLKDCTAFIIIEAIVEKAEAKIELFKSLARYNNEEVIFASNTSSISISLLQEQIVAPQRVLGMHFFNPPTIMPLVEVIRGKQTTQPFIDAAMMICKKIGKQAVLCKDAPGFIVNRVARQYYLESLFLAGQGVADFESIDRILEATGFKMGPFKLMDMIGMDINLATTESLYEAFGKPERLKPSLLQVEKVRSGALGKKTGRGFYNYEP